MAHTIKIILSLAIPALLLCSCSVRNQNQESADTDLQQKKSIAWLLAGNSYKAWAIESFRVDGIDQLKGLAACELDNLDVYHRNFVFESVEGNQRCKSNDPEIRRRGKWSLNADSTAIEVKLGTDLVTLQIIELTEKKLHYRSTMNQRVTEAVLVAGEYTYPAIIDTDNNQ